MDTISKAERSSLMSAVRTTGSSPEATVRQLVGSLTKGIRFNDKTLPGTPDLVIPRAGLLIFVNGCFWHAHSCRRGKPPKTNEDFWFLKRETNKRRDARTRRALNRLGW